MWVRTDSPCSNCTRAMRSTSWAPFGFSVSRISFDVAGGRVPKSHRNCGSRADGSGEARRKSALAGGGTRTWTWLAAARDGFSTRMW